MRRKEISDRIAWVPAWALSLVAAVFAAFMSSVLRNYIDEPLTYIIWSLILVIASFLICILHPANVWIVPLLCNILDILPASCDDTFWSTSFGAIIGAGVVFSFIAAHVGAFLGRERVRNDNS